MTRRDRDDEYEEDDRARRRGARDDKDYDDQPARRRSSGGESAGRKSKAENPYEIILKRVRTSYLHCFKPYAGKNQDGGTNEPRYTCTFLLDPDDPSHKKQIRQIEEIIERCMRDKWQGKTRKLPPDKVCLRDGNNYDKPEYEDMMLLASGNARKPHVVDQHKRPMDHDGTFESGDYCNAVIRIWAQDNTFGKRINASLEGLQFVKRGERFAAAGIDPDDVFDEIDDEDGEDALRGRRGRDEDDEDDRDARERQARRRNRRSERDDEDEPPRGRRSRDDEDEDEPPRGRRLRDDDDELDEPPRRRRESVV